MGQPAPNHAAEPEALSEEDLYYTDLPVGEILKRARMHYGQSLPDIERSLRIRASQIQAIEDGALDQLPGRVYAIGFVRSYAEYLGLDGNKMVNLFKLQYGRKTDKPELDFPVAASDSKIPPLWLVIASVAVVILMSSLWFNFQTRDREFVEEVPAVEDALSAASVKIEGEMYGPYIPEGYNPQAEIKAVEDIQQEGIILTIAQNSWVEIKDSTGKTIVSQVLKAGDQYFVPDRPDLLMSLGNAAGVQVQVNGKDLEPLGQPGTVLRDVPLDIEYLEENFKATPPTSLE